MKLSHITISLVCVFAASNLMQMANEKFELIAADYGPLGPLFIIATGFFLIILGIVMFFRAFRKA
ncbi:hypothetical protein [uncultured Roseibium sp.]|uniref:hypothetical protein n=1 Tax=uncultured Roseibium sp. TaxID=1936171 RepID=UPI00262613F5|nr:hypothetical protein [uncultured Roseibium sp.]